jgi:hypothetical protein
MKAKATQAASRKAETTKSATKRNSRNAAIFFFALAALVGVLVLGVWIASQYLHF